MSLNRRATDTPGSRWEALLPFVASSAGIASVALVALTLAAPPALAATPKDVLAALVKEAGGVAPSPAEGEKLFNTNFGKDLGLSCSSCHGTVPTQEGKDQITEKKIAPLAPAFNAKRFTDLYTVNFKFNVNCKDVVGRACTAAEKANVLSWLISLKP